MVLPLLALLFLVVPLVELYTILQVGQNLGALNTIGLLILVSLLGGWLVRREGMQVFVKAQAELEAGRVPAASLVDGMFVLFAGALLLTPGFLTDVGGLVLLFPPTRRVLRPLVVRRLRARAAVTFGLGGTRPADRGRPRPGRTVVDAEVVDAKVVDVDGVDRDAPPT